MQSPEAGDGNSPLSGTKASGGISRQNLLSLYLPAFILSIGTGIAAPVLPVFAKTFNVSFGVASLIVIVQMVGGAASTIPTGYLVDRFGRRRVLLAGPLLTAVSSFLVATARSFPQLLVYRFIGGWAQQMWMLSRLAVIADTGARRERGRQINGMQGLQRIGSLVGPALGGFTAAAVGIRVPFIIHGVLAILAIIPSFTLIRETNPGRPAGAPRSSVAPVDAEAPAERSKPTSSSYSYRELLVAPVLVLFAAQILANIIRGTGGQGGGGPLFLYAVYAYDTGPATLGVLATMGAIIGVPLVFFAGYLMDRYSRKAGVVPGTSLMGAGMLFLAASAYFGWSFVTFIGGFIWANAAVSLMSGSMQTMGSDIAPPHARGKFFGVQRLLAEVGSLLSPVSFALLSETVNYTTAFLFMGAIGLLASFWIMVMIKSNAGGETQGVPVRAAPPTD